MTRRPAVPSVDGVLSAPQIRRTAASIAAQQEPDGAIPWTTGQPTDAWNHVEAAMGLLVGGEPDAAHAAYEWCVRAQRADGSWPMTTRQGCVEDAGGETNMSAYLAVGVWHHWLVRRDRAFVRRMWPSVRAGLDFVSGLQLSFGGIAWAQGWVAGRPGRPDDGALLAGSSSIHQSLRAGLALAELVGEAQPGWERASGRLAHALRRHRDEFLDRSTFSMDWYYPVLGGAVTGAEAHALIAARWDRFVVDGLGVRCVDTNPWVTGAETCELVLALEAIGDPRAAGLFTAVQHLREEDSGGYWTGWVYPDHAFWPEEHTTYTAAAVILAADALTGTTAGAGIMRGREYGPVVPEPAPECGCSPHRLARDTVGAR